MAKGSATVAPVRGGSGGGLTRDFRLRDVREQWSGLADGPDGCILSAARTEAAFDATADRRLLCEISPFYGDLDRGFRATHVPAVGSLIESYGFSSIAKVALGVLHGGDVVGKLVLTVKRGRKLKVGPVYLEPRFRGKQLAVSALETAAKVAASFGYTGIYATAPASHPPAVGLLENASFARVAAFESHYREGVDEVVYFRDLVPVHAWPRVAENAGRAAEGVRSQQILCSFVEKHYFSIDDEWRQWLAAACGLSLGNFERKPHDLLHRGSCVALLVYKRGGTTKIVPAGPDADFDPSILDRWEAVARTARQRKVSVFWPARFPHLIQLLSSAGYVLESEVVAGRYAVYEPLVVWSKILHEDAR